MSIVCFDGKVLAADSRKTIKKRKADGTLEYTRTVDEQVKIELIQTHVRFRGEQVEAVGRCGNLKLSTAVIDELKAGVDIETVWADEEKRKAFKNPASILILTDRDAYHFRVSPKLGLTVTVLERKPFAMGSGTAEAMFLMDTFKLPACEAAMAVTLKFKSCGGAIQVFKRDRWTGRLQPSEAKCNTHDGNQRKILVASAVLRHVGRLKRRAEERLAESVGNLSLSTAAPVSQTSSEASSVSTPPTPTSSAAA